MCGARHRAQVFRKLSSCLRTIFNNSVVESASALSTSLAAREMARGFCRQLLRQLICHCGSSRYVYEYILCALFDCAFLYFCSFKILERANQADKEPAALFIGTVYPHASGAYKNRSGSPPLHFHRYEVRVRASKKARGTLSVRLCRCCCLLPAVECVTGCRTKSS